MATSQDVSRLIEEALTTEATSLNLNFNHLTSLPESITNLTNLTSLYLRNNHLTSLPENITKLVNLTSLDLSNNNLTSLPESITKLNNLTNLYLGGNQLANLPESIAKLTNLTNLYLSGNQLTNLPESMANLTKLTELQIMANRLVPLPSVLMKLTSLDYLDLDNNGLTTLPESIGQLTGLTGLDLSNNQLTNLPKSISQLTNLNSLDLSNNRLINLPESITKLNNLTRLYLSANPLDLSPEIISTSDTRRILDYLRQLHVTPTANQPMNEAKVILVGEAKVGKTSLINRLINGTFNEHEPKTDGIDIHRWDLGNIYCSNRAGEVDSTARTVRLNVWDLGGQEIYHSTHQFFLTERTLYLLVISARLTDEQNRLHYWLKTIRALGKDAPILIVHNQYETNPEQLDRKSLREKYPSISPDGFLETSCADDTLKGIDTLQAAIRREIGRMHHVADPLPPTYFDVKERLEEETKSHDFVSGEDYKRLCEAVGVTNLTERKNILALLHALGTVISFQQDHRLRDTNVLKPEWVTEGVYAVLDDATLKKAADGLLSIEVLSRILGPRERYPESKYSYILDMMAKFELCFERPGRPGEYLVPELLTPIEPDDLGEFDDALHFELQYEFLPRSILPRFIVGTHHLLQTYRWRNGVVIEREGCRALVRADLEENRIRIAVTGNTNTRRDLLSVIRDQFDRIHQTPETLAVEEMVPLTKYPKAKAVPYRHLRQLEDKRRGKFTWLDVPDDLSVSKLLNGIERIRRKDDTRSSAASEKKEFDESDSLPHHEFHPLPTVEALMDTTDVLSCAPDNSRYLQELADRVQSNSVVPFVGAGMSIPLGMPGWEAALDSLFDNAGTLIPPKDARRYGTAIERHAWEEAAQILWDAERLGSKWFNDQITGLFGKHKLHAPITSAVALLPRFAHGPVLTTNFDAALETVYKAAGQNFTDEQIVLGPYRADSVIDAWDERKRLLLKLHGDADESAGRVLTKEQYEHAYNKVSKLPELLRTLFGSRRPLLFLGCSLLADRTLKELYTAGVLQSNAHHYALLELPVPPQDRQTRQNELIAQYGIKPIWFARGDFAALERILTFLAEAYALKA